jgi:hypothetical protein
VTQAQRSLGLVPTRTERGLREPSGVRSAAQVTAEAEGRLSRSQRALPFRRALKVCENSTIRPNSGVHAGDNYLIIWQGVIDKATSMSRKITFMALLT